MRESRRRGGWTAAATLLAVVAVLLAGAPGEAAQRCVGTSPLGEAATVNQALLIATSLPRASVARHDAELAAGACRAAPDAGGRCRAFDAARCRDALRTLYDALSQGTRDHDAITRNFSRVVRTQVSDALSRLSWASASETRGTPVESRPAPIQGTIQVIGDGRTLRVRPLRALRAGRRYRLVVTGLPEGHVVHWYAGSGSTAGAKLADDLGQAYDSVLSGEALQLRAGAARTLLARVATDAGAIPDVPAAAGILLTLDEPLDGATLARVRARFEPTSAAAQQDGFTVPFRTLDPVAGLVAYRTFLAGSSCAGDERGIALEPFDAGIADAALAGVFRGRYRSLDLRERSRARDPLGVPPGDARATELPFLLALPKGYSEATAVVLTVHGHGGSAEAMLKAHAIGLARRGMATLALDLPAHGERSHETPFIDPLRPERSTLGIRQATIDALALFQAATRCGFAAPDGATLRPGSLRYFGYSLGAGVGVLVRAVEKRLGTTVLVAPPGDLVAWQVQQVPKDLGARSYTICNDGPAHGRTCLGPDDCADGVCTFDPRLLLLGDLLDFPYDVLFGGADPVAFAGERTGDASVAPLLLIAGGVDMTVGPLAGARLASLYGMKLDARGGRRGASKRFVYWSGLGHDLIAKAAVREQAYDFLMNGGRRGRAPRDAGAG